MSVPDPLGRDRLATGAAMYKPPVYGEKPPPKPLLRQPRVIALLVVVALVVVWVGVKKLTSGSKDSPSSAAKGVIELFLAEDYGQMRSKLCSADRGQVGENDLESAGREGAVLLRTLDKPFIDAVTDVNLSGGFAGTKAKQVQGHITATVGTGTRFKVVTVHEGGSWRVCLNAGGYGLSAFNLDVPIGGDLETINP